MHARNRTWALGSDPAERCRQRTLPVEGGDGSTLSLDFTTGVLDPRLTFTRSTNATFINSSGLVEWANSNMYWNTGFEGLSGTNPSLTSSGWGYVFATGNAIFNGDGTVTITTTASDRRAIFRSSGFTGNGLRVVAAVDVTIHSGSLTASQVLVTGTPTNAQHYVNGVIWNSSHPIWNGGVLPVGTSFNIAYATDSLTGSTTSMYFGVGCTSAIAGSATFSNPRWTMWKGSGTVPYYPNTSATNNSTANYFKSNDYQAPRFDFDPTSIGTPRGLLIEGSANNLVTNSSAMWNWGTNGVARVQDTTIQDITGQTGTSNITTKVDKASGAGAQYNTLQAAIPSITVPANTIVDVTFSVWIRMNSAGQPKCSLGILDTSGTPSFGATFGTQSPGGQSVSNSSVTMSSYPAALCDYTFGSATSWVRCSVSRRLNNTTASPINWTTGLVLIYPDQFTTNAATIYVCGGQVELGIGPSSWIPTGASTGSRSADSCVMTGTNFSSWFAGATAGTFYSEFDNPRATIGAAQTPASIGLGDYSAGNLLSAYFGGYTVGQALVAAIWGSGGTGFQTATVPTSVSVATGNKAAFAFSGQSVMGGFRGNASASATTTGTVNAKTVLYIGGNGASGTTNRDFLNSCVQRIKFFPTQFTAAQLQALTT